MGCRWFRNEVATMPKLVGLHGIHGRGGLFFASSCAIYITITMFLAFISGPLQAQDAAPPTFEEPANVAQKGGAVDDAADLVPEEKKADLPEASHLSESSVGGRLGRGDHTPKDRVFGKYRIRLAANKPKFDDGLKFYDDLYGDTRWYPSIAADWFAWDWYVTFGLSFRAGYYTASGYNAKDPGTGKELSDYESRDISKDYDSPSSLTLIPTQYLLAMEFTPFQKKWLVLDGWFGFERLYFQEVRTTKDDATGSAAALMLVDSSDEGSETDSDALTSKGFVNSTVIGFAANILLNPLNESSPRSLDVMGLGYVYLSPFMEIVRTMKKDSISFGRSSVGVAFTFESLH